MEISLGCNTPTMLGFSTGWQTTTTGVTIRGCEGRHCYSTTPQSDRFLAASSDENPWCIDIIEAFLSVCGVSFSALVIQAIGIRTTETGYFMVNMDASCHIFPSASTIPNDLPSWMRIHDVCKLSNSDWKRLFCTCDDPSFFWYVAYRNTWQFYSPVGLPWSKTMAMARSFPLGCTVILRIKIRGFQKQTWGLLDP